VNFAIDLVERLGGTVMEEMEILFPLERDLVDVSLSLDELYGKWHDT
jgi:hypothetical protein